MCKITLRVLTYLLCVKLHTVRNTTHFRICVKLHTLCNIKAVSFTYPLEILHLTEYFYTTSGCDGCDKYEVCWQVMSIGHRACAIINDIQSIGMSCLMLGIVLLIGVIGR